MAQLSTVANRDPASLQPDNVDDHDGRESHDADRDSDEAGASQERGTWTPEPEPYDAEKFAAWGRKHYGDDWYEQREKMFEERKFATNPHQDPIYKQRQKALREMEREREKGKLPTKGKPWQEVLAWARMHYGEEWYRHREALDRDRQEVREALDPDERKKKSLKVGRRRNLLRDIQWERDEEMLAAGKTWYEIMAWPPEPSNIMPSVETSGDVALSPSSSSEHSDGSGPSTYPPTPTDFRREAMDGPHGPGGYLNQGTGHLDQGTHGNCVLSGWRGTQFDRVRLRRNMKKTGLGCQVR
ncbi:hypothetical protein B0T17DRAFT_620320 [Bombardia bombarda]|uniref:Uncharacterized protein n=1 Tax=Bombardia bombarda TaxID=252184 RepID=A0AA39T2J6_9PEZI|nr:hypothetical protein B0T17DRAFT_620320 [Bombardia bombarda]